jgi:hypothetical protein
LKYPESWKKKGREGDLNKIKRTLVLHAKLLVEDSRFSLGVRKGGVLLLFNEAKNCDR